MIGSIGRAQESLVLLDRAEQRAAWQEALRGLAGREAIHGLVRGRCCRLLLDDGALAAAEFQRHARLALSPAVSAPRAAAWIAGVTGGSGLLLLQQEALWVALDGWLRELAPEAFVELLPPLRRAFAALGPPERRAMGERVKRLGGEGRGTDGIAPPGSFDGMAGVERERADRVLPVLARVLGVELHGDR